MCDFLNSEDPEVNKKPTLNRALDPPTALKGNND